MSEVTVTRGSQITLTKEVREKLGVEEGDTVTVNVSGENILITKKDSRAFEKQGFLPEDFGEMLDETRKDSTGRMERLME